MPFATRIFLAHSTDKDYVLNEQALVSLLLGIPDVSEYAWSIQDYPFDKPF